MKVFLTTVAITAVLDFLWLGLIAPKIYSAALGEFLRLSPEGKLKPILWAAALVYICIPLGIYLFVLPKADADTTWLQMAAWGAALGFVIYGTYDMTNYCLLERWPLTISLVDWAWGCTLCGASSALAFSLAKAWQLT